MRRIAEGVIRLYQLMLSPILCGLGVGCRFYPSCSAYSMEAFQKYSWPHALMLTIRRLLRCHPLHPGGVDPA